MLFIVIKTVLFLKPYIATVVSENALGQPEYRLINQIKGEEILEIIWLCINIYTNET